MALIPHALTLSFPLLPHSDDNPKTATLYAVLVDPETGARLERSIAIEVDPAANGLAIFLPLKQDLEFVFGGDPTVDDLAADFRLNKTHSCANFDCHFSVLIAIDCLGTAFY